VILSAVQIQKELDSEDEGSFFIAPRLLTELTNEQKGTASIDLRLGSWFVAPKSNQIPCLDIVNPANEISEEALTSRKFMAIGANYILHPGNFVLAATLEWISMPNRLCGYVTGKSSWGRRGLVIETAPGVHPGFSGCLTLEVANVGEVPISLTVGMAICQLFLHRLDEPVQVPSDSLFAGSRKPKLGKIRADPLVDAWKRHRI